jgi:hypothetical protein
MFPISFCLQKVNRRQTVTVRDKVPSARTMRSCQGDVSDRANRHQLAVNKFILDMTALALRVRGLQALVRATLQALQSMFGVLFRRAGCCPNPSRLRVSARGTRRFLQDLTGAYSYSFLVIMFVTRTA